jgi:hypothetical protein
MDEFFEVFISELGEPNPNLGNELKSVILKYKKLLPDFLISSFWEKSGFASFANGLFWITNPDDYSTIIKEWLNGFSEFNPENFFVFARTAFGRIYALSPNTNEFLTVSCTSGVIVTDKKNKGRAGNIDNKIKSFFVGAYSRDFDMLDLDESPLFERALKKLGALSSNEVYGYENLAAGGIQSVLPNIKIFNIFEHLSQLRNTSKPILRLL